jgi:hypothetical protein
MMKWFLCILMATEQQLDSTQLRISRRPDSSEKGKEGYCVVIWMLER